MDTNSDSVFLNELILTTILSKMGVSQLKCCSAVNSHWNSLCYPILAQKAKVTISVTRFNMYKISYEPQSWKEYFNERVATLQNLSISNLFIQLRSAHSPPQAEQDIIKLLSTSGNQNLQLNCLKLDITFQTVNECYDLCAKLCQNRSISELIINFRLLQNRDDFFIGRRDNQGGMNVIQSVKKLVIENFPMSSHLDERDVRNLEVFLQFFLNLESILINGIHLAVIFLKSVMSVEQEQAGCHLPRLNSLYHRLNGDALDIAEVELLCSLLPQSCKRLTGIRSLALLDIPEMDEVNKLGLDECLRSCAKIVKNVRFTFK